MPATVTSLSLMPRNSVSSSNVFMDLWRDAQETPASAAVPTTLDYVHKHPSILFESFEPLLQIRVHESFRRRSSLLGVTHRPTHDEATQMKRVFEGEEEIRPNYKLAPRPIRLQQQAWSPCRQVVFVQKRRGRNNSAKYFSREGLVDGCYLSSWSSPAHRRRGASSFRIFDAPLLRTPPRLSSIKPLLVEKDETAQNAASGRPCRSALPNHPPSPGRYCTLSRYR